MPTYQYRCTNCGNELEAVQKFTDPALTECPQCQGALRKVYNAVGVVFKGSGFYRTDSRAGKSTGGGQSEGRSAASSGDGASKAADSGAAASSTSSSTKGGGDNGGEKSTPGSSAGAKTASAGASKD